MEGSEKTKYSWRSLANRECWNLWREFRKHFQPWHSVLTVTKKLSDSSFTRIQEISVRQPSFTPNTRSFAIVCYGNSWQRAMQMLMGPPDNKKYLLAAVNQTYCRLHLRRAARASSKLVSRTATSPRLINKVLRAISNQGAKKTFPALNRMISSKETQSLSIRKSGMKMNSKYGT